MFRWPARRLCSNAVVSIATGDLTVHGALPNTLLTRPGGNKMKLAEGEPEPYRYALLGSNVGAPLRSVKLKYLLACRRHHPECGGDPEMFLRVSLAYQDILKDYGIESIGGEIINLGNFQSCTYEARNYIEARAKIAAEIPISTLDDYIAELEATQSKVSVDMEARLSANDTDAMWLLEDIEKVMAETGQDVVTLTMLDDGHVTARAPTPLELEGAATATLIGSSSKALEGPPSGEPNESAKSENQGDREPSTTAKALETVTLTRDEIRVLNAKYMVEERTDVAGSGASTATDIMNNTEEVYKIRQEIVLLFWLASFVFFLIYVGLEAIMRARKAERRNPGAKNEILSTTMLPWWGNDEEYESQVKRIFVDEWRRARSSARRVQTFQEGVARESLDDDEKESLDLSIFAITADRVKQMKDNADAQAGRI